MNITDPTSILFYAFRYALGRSTYAVGTVVKEIHSNWNNLRKDDKEQFVQEIMQAKRHPGGKGLGMEMDEKEWMSIVNRYNAENKTDPPGDPMFGGLMKE